MDADYNLPGLPILFVISALIVGLRIPSIIAINTAGHFKQVKQFAVIEALINITLSVILTVKLNIYGVLIATIVAGLYRTPVLIYYVYTNIYKKSLFSLLKKIAIGSVVFFLAYIVSGFIHFVPSNLFDWFFAALMALVSVTIVVLLVILVCNRPLLSFIFSIINKKN